MFAKPQEEHRWLNQLAGEWSLSHDCKMPNGNTGKTSGTMTCRSMGGLWLICESSGKSSAGDSWSSIMTVGFDPQKNRYVGAFLGSMMANIWLYEGDLDSTQKRLPLVTEGPAFDGNKTCKYRDTIEIVDPNRWLFTSEYQDNSGQWISFLSGEQVRISSTEETLR